MIWTIVLFILLLLLNIAMAVCYFIWRQKNRPAPAIQQTTSLTENVRKEVPKVATPPRPMPPPVQHYEPRIQDRYIYVHEDKPKAVQPNYYRRETAFTRPKHPPIASETPRHVPQTRFNPTLTEGGFENFGGQRQFDKHDRLEKTPGRNNTSLNNSFEYNFDRSFD